MQLIVFDLETTGLSPQYHDIIQIAAARVQVGEWIVREQFASFVRPPGGRVPGHITALTGIRPEHVADAPAPAEALRAFSRFAGEGALLIAHNGRRFDLPFLRASCERHGLAVRDNAFLDSCTLSRHLWGGRGGHGLDAVMARLGLSGDGLRRHDARDDVALLAEAVRRMWTRLDVNGSGCPVPTTTGLLPVAGP